MNLYDLPEDAVHIPATNGPGLVVGSQDAADELMEMAEANGRRLRAQRVAQSTWDGGDAA